MPNLRETAVITAYRNDLRLLVSLIPEELQDDRTYEAANRLVYLIEQSGGRVPPEEYTQ